MPRRGALGTFERRIDPALGYPLTAFVMVRVAPLLERAAGTGQAYRARTGLCSTR